MYGFIEMNKLLGSEDETCFSIYAGISYHPFGTQSGYWLTQILSLTDSLTHWINGANHTLGDGSMSISRIVATLSRRKDILT